MGNNWLPWILLGGVLLGGFLLLRGVGSALGGIGSSLADPKIQGGINKIFSPEFKSIVQDQVSGKITQAQADARAQALAKAKYAYYY
jgi:hypothetical protein